MSESASVVLRDGASAPSTTDGTGAAGVERLPPNMLPATGADSAATTPGGAGLRSPTAPAEEPPPVAEVVQRPAVNSSAGAATTPAGAGLRPPTAPAEEPPPVAEVVQRPVVNAYYKLQLDTGECLSGADKNAWGARKLTVTTSATASVFLLEAPTKGNRGRPTKNSYTLFMCDGGYLKADAAANRPISTTAAKKGAK